MPTQLADKIVSTYSQQLDTLQSKEIRHFLSRAYFATQDTTYLTNLKTNYNHTINPLGPDLFTNDYDFYCGTPQLWQIRRRTAKPRKVRVWSKFPEFAVLEELFTVYRYQLLLTQPLPPLPTTLISTFVGYLRYNSQFVYHSTTVAINVFYGAKNYAGIDETKEIPDLLDSLFSPVTTNDLANYIYGLTHIALGATQFYKHSFDPATYEWLYHSLKQHEAAIITHGSRDLQAEVALVYSWFDPTDPFLNQTITNLAAAYDEKLQCIPRDETDAPLANSEHLNALFLLLVAQQNGQSIWWGDPN